MIRKGKRGRFQQEKEDTRGALTRLLVVAIKGNRRKDRNNTIPVE